MKKMNFWILISPPGNLADNNHGLLKRILKKVKGFCFGDKGYAKTLWKDFYENGLKIMTQAKSKTQAKLMNLQERDATQKTYDRECK